MSKRFLAKQRRLIRQATSVRISEILPFSEKPSLDRNLDGAKRTEPKPDGLQASELFSIFTADIIKQDIIFTR